MLEKKIEQCLARLAEVEAKLGGQNVFSDPKAYKELTQEHARLAEIARLASEQKKLSSQLEDNRGLLMSETDPSTREVFEEDSKSLEASLAKIHADLSDILIPPDPLDSKNTILELRAGTGGDEAALFVGDCARMYKMYADRMGWNWEHISSTPSDLGGFKDYVLALSGPNVYRHLRYEGGTHRVQRVPATEAQGRIHTSAITIAVLIEPDEDSEIEVDERDLRVDTYRSSGAGGQHVNTTDSAVRLTHMPSGIVVYCQQERSQHKNKEKALRLLKAKLEESELEKKRKELSSSRAEQVGTGDRSERIRTYNFPQNRVTDHRINFTKYNLDQVMEGELIDFSKGLIAFYLSEGAKE